MFREGNYLFPDASTETFGTAKIDTEILDIDDDGTLHLKTQFYSQSIAPYEGIKNVLEKYYSGKFSLEDVQSIQAIGDARDAKDHEDFSFEGHTIKRQELSYGTQIQKDIAIPKNEPKQIIIDFNHTPLKNSINNINNALITIQMSGVISNGDTTYISFAPGTANQSGGGVVNSQQDSPVREYLNNTFYEKCNFKNLIKIIYVQTKSYNANILIQTEDKVFLLSENEIFNSATCSQGGEGIQYEYYKIESNRIKKSGFTETGDPVLQQERSPYKNSSSYQCGVSSSGTASSSYNSSSNSYTLSPVIAL